MPVTFLWHFHQPLYRHPSTGEFILPWVRLHGTRAYYDMPRVLLEFEHFRANFNLVPSLLSQIEAYASGEAKDHFLTLSTRRPEDLSAEERGFIVRYFFMVNHDTGIRPMPRYAELLARRGRDPRGRDLEAVARDFSDKDIRDLQVLFNLAWFGFKAREEHRELDALVEKGRDFTEDDKAVLLRIQRDVVAAVVPAFQEAFRQGRAELSVTPFFHPILPLVIDTDSARRAMPDVRLPPRFAWPDDAREQVRRALAKAESMFGERPIGMWPAEGSVSPEAAALLAEQGVRWFASDEGVLMRSLPAGTPRDAALREPWIVEAAGREIVGLFRDHGLSDEIGFNYARQSPEASVEHLVSGVARAGAAEGLITLALDGENPWEGYPASGRDFLRTLGRRFDKKEAAGVETVRIRDHLQAHPPRRRLSTLHTGSWIEANFRIWIGHAEDVEGWTRLGATRQRFEEKKNALAEADRSRALDSILAAEGSDWFWWFGDDFVTETAAEFDALFRAHLEAAWRAMGEEPPASLRTPISRVALEQTNDAVMPTAFVHPDVDGVESHYFEWTGAGFVRPRPGQGSMYRTTAVLSGMWFGFDLEHLYLRLDLAKDGQRGAPHGMELILEGATPSVVRVALGPGAIQPEDPGNGRKIGRGAFRDIVELQLPLQELGLKKGMSLGLAVQVQEGGATVDRLPRAGELRLVVPGEDFERLMWKA
jgi:alpha-amylase/alpha-mannosidase (GH57 family)